jgi:hypothetical protein
LRDVCASFRHACDVKCEHSGARTEDQELACGGARRRFREDADVLVSRYCTGADLQPVVKLAEVLGEPIVRDEPEEPSTLEGPKQVPDIESGWRGGMDDADPKRRSTGTTDAA